jgi:hypothetical protein
MIIQAKPNNFFFFASKVKISLTHSLTHGAELFLEAANCAATQELPSILWNPKVHYRVHKSPALAPIMNQINQMHTNHPILSL